jgi:RNA polymerase sigma-70 factor (ECF subfamily)
MKNKTQIFEDFYKENKQSIFLFTLAKTNSREDALDITAETFLSAWENLDNFRGQSTYKTWLFAICRHKINDYFRKSYKDNSVFDHSFEIENYNIEELEDNSDSVLINKFSLKELFNKLKEIEKDLLLLKYTNNLNFSECASVLNMSETNARVLHHRIINKLKAFIN